MKAVSVVAPSGTKIAMGVKTLEVRRWRPDLLPDEDLLIVQNTRYLRDDGAEDPDGRAVALVKVTGIRPFLPEDIAAACANYFEEGWLAWELSEIRPLALSARVLAAKRLYEVTLPEISLPHAVE